MRFQSTCVTLMGLLSLAASGKSHPRHSLASVLTCHSAPSDSLSNFHARRGLQWKSKRSPLTIVQEVQETNIIVVQDNQAELDALQQLAEQQFAQLIEAQLALVSQLQTVKDNIRVNHFRAQFSQANTVIVTVTTMVDARADQGAQNRYMVNQLLADNGKPDSQIMVMVSDAETMTIGASQTVDIAGIESASAVSTPTAVPQIAVADPNAPFGQVNQSMIMPIGAAAPAIDVIFADPAAIILPGQTNLFVVSPL
ncbi:Uu.00g003300.m01.CDS01 [Anthostomella pinea]|uniref:Uu.00g003300.m01.CDS01 n=1 Tax=Anthostomella pinea TaxID=933095 RepID=A0AAI8VJQ1_9PEZI|nr:Uu.00g003300.m01.CDS01 [Anthostomella pinea]